MEDENRKLAILFEEDRNLIEYFRYDNGKVIKDGLILRIYQQNNGKFCLYISVKSDSSNFLDEVIYRIEDQDDKDDIHILMLLDEHIYTRGGKLSYKILSLYEKAWVKISIGILIGFVLSKLL